MALDPSAAKQLKQKSPQSSRRGSILVVPKVLNAVSRASKSVRIRLDSVQTDDTFPKVSHSMIHLENTYKTSPDEDKEFSSCRAEKAIQQVLDQTLHNKKYSAEEVQQLTVMLSNDIKQEVKNLDFPRYKIVCSVIVGENGGQALQTASRSLWDEKNDNYACATFQNGSIFAIASVYGVYYD